MRNIKIGFVMVMSMLLLDSCSIIPRPRTDMERRLYRSGLYIHPRIKLYKRRYIPILPNYLPKDNRGFNSSSQKPR